MYVVLGMCPVIAFTVSFLSQFMNNPGRPHWEAVKRFIRYLKGMQDHSLVIVDGGHLKWTRGTQNSLQGFCNTNWASQEHCLPL